MTSVFISYSHDSQEHKRRILDFSIRLRAEGVDAMMDQWMESPPEGWPRWMLGRIQNSDYVLVVYTKGYYDKINQTGKIVEGLGARAEDQLITQEIFDNGGLNEKIIPIIFDSADLVYVPMNLKPYTRYCLDAEYDKLYRRLTQQPLSVPPPVGSVRRLAEENSTGGKSDSVGFTPHPLNDVLLQGKEGGAFYGTYESVKQSGSMLSISIETMTDGVSVLQKIGEIGNEVIVSYGLSCKMGSVKEFASEVRRGMQTTNINLELRDISCGMEVNLGGMSADELAKMRARRILLNQFPPPPSSGVDINDVTREVFIRRNGGIGDVEDSVLVRVARVAGISVESMAYAKLAAVAELILSCTVESIDKLHIAPIDAKSVDVDFSGKRNRGYSNRPATVIAFQEKGILLD